MSYARYFQCIIGCINNYFKTVGIATDTYSEVYSSSAFARTSGKDFLCMSRKDHICEGGLRVWLNLK